MPPSSVDHTPIAHRQQQGARVAGSIEALYFIFEGMGPAGAQILPGADFRAPPWA